MINQWKCRTTCKLPHSLFPNHESTILHALFDTPYEGMKNILRFYQFWKTDNDLEPVFVNYDDRISIQSGKERWIGLCLREPSSTIEFDLFCEGAPPQLDDIEIIEQVAEHKSKIRTWSLQKHLISDYHRIVTERSLQGKKLWEQDWPHTKIVLTCGGRHAEWFPRVEHFTYKFPIMNKLKRTITLDVDERGGIINTLQYLYTNREQLLGLQ
jgi:hypothetical protein